jgi:hypothetical protein
MASPQHTLRDFRMDKQIMALLIPILALSIPVIAILSNALQKIWRLRIEEARVHAGGLRVGAEAELDQVRTELDLFRRELTEVQERLDFAERLLAQRGDRPPLQSPAQLPNE